MKFEILGYGPDGSGPCRYEVEASSKEEASIKFQKQYPQESFWGYSSLRAMPAPFCGQCPQQWDLSMGQCPHCGLVVNYYDETCWSYGSPI